MILFYDSIFSCQNDFITLSFEALMFGDPNKSHWKWNQETIFINVNFKQNSTPSWSLFWGHTNNGISTAQQNSHRLQGCVSTL